MAMAANTSGISNDIEDEDEDVLDFEDDDEDYWIKEDDEWRNVLREISSDGLKKERPVIQDLCKLALTHYQNNHPGETYECVGLQKVLCGLVAGIEYSITFCAKNLKADVVETFEARGFDLIGEDELKIESCVLLK